jgi:hypothetical protein
MTLITLEVPDELAGRLAPLKNRLPQVLTLALDLLGFPNDSPYKARILSPVLSEIIGFLASGPTHEDIVAYKISPQAQARLEQLLYKNREDQLALPERAELDTYQQVNHLLILLKAHARARLASSN